MLIWANMLAIPHLLHTSDVGWDVALLYAYLFDIYSAVRKAFSRKNGKKGFQKKGFRKVLYFPFFGP